jgi:hypothetical protein
MELLIAVASFGMIALASVLFLVQSGARELGYWFGRRHGSPTPDEREGIGVVVGTMLGLLSFVIAISLGSTSTRYDQRRAVTLAEANAIATARVRTDPIDDPRSAAIGRMIQRYAQVRADFVAAPGEASVLERLDGQALALQQQIWSEFVPLMREKTNPATANLEIALNQMFEASRGTRFALFTPYAEWLFWLLMAMALIAMAGLGYQLGLRGKPLRVLATLLTVMWTMVIVSIVDLGSARVGGIRISVAPYEWAIQSFEPLQGN